VGTGDGAAVLQRARAQPATLAIGVDTNAGNLREAIRKAAKPAHKGGLPNALFVVRDATPALEALAGRVDELSIVLPWGSLLRAVLEGEREFALAVAGSL
jgi:16S rRNA (adenine(1408)-N(1))-methyltransferase